MGFNKNYLEEITLLNLSLKDKDLLELGDQEIYDSSIGTIGQKLRHINFFKPKSYTVYDIQESDGVTYCDLSQPIKEPKKFDIITNFGTTEHVELEDGQFNCWVNIHNMLKEDSTLINIVPCDNGGWIGHCRYYYTKKFFNSFEDIGYKLIEYKIVNDLCCLSVLRKDKHLNFLEKDVFWSNILVKKENNSGIIHGKNNPKNLIF